MPGVENPELSGLNFEPVKSNLNFRQVVFYNPDADRFIKLDLRPKVAEFIRNFGGGDVATALMREYQGQRTSVKIALGLSDDEVDNTVRIVYVKNPQGEELAGVESTYLGVNVATAMKKNLISDTDIPKLAIQLFDHAEQIYDQIGLYNKDLNANNVLINMEQGRPKIIIIDWANSTHGKKIGMQASAMRKFFVSLYGGEKNSRRQAIIAQTMEISHSIEMRKVLQELFKRNNY